MIRTAPEGRWFIAAAWAIALALLLAALHYGTLLWWIVAVVWLVLAPADGKVVSVIETDEPAFFGGRAVRISIFMNVFNCHVTRYPAGGTVDYRHYNRGKFGHAAAEKSSLDNEQASVGLKTDRGKVLIRQIAGLIARRIVTDHNVGTPVRKGERMGMIRFGSRVDLFLPLGTEILVKPGDTTQVAVTPVAKWC